MDNSYFICTDKNQIIVIERFHICTWEFNNNYSLIEFGSEICASSLFPNQLKIDFYIPWLSKECKTTDLYSKLKDSTNSRFIFNESIYGTTWVDPNQDSSGAIHKFHKKSLCVLPITVIPDYDASKLSITIDLSDYNSLKLDCNIYFRFLLEPNKPSISTRKNGITKSTIIYDTRVNNFRNLPSSLMSEFKKKEICSIKVCYYFNIIPNRYDLTFLENESLQNVRNLEYESFYKYLGNSLLKKDDLIVIYNRRKDKDNYSFFAIYTREKIGADQVAIAIFVNIACNILLFIPAYKTANNISVKPSLLFNNLPFYFDISLLISLLILLYFIIPFIYLKFSQLVFWIKN